MHALWHYRRFILGSVQREFRARYLNTALGAAWLLLAPFAMILVYTLVFTQLMQNRLAGSAATYSYSIYLCAGLLPWQWFTELLSRHVGLFVDHAALIKKASFPWLSLSVIAIISSACNFALIAVLFLLFLAYIGPWPGWALIALLPLFLLQSLFAAGLGIILGVLHVFFRDVGQAVGIVLQFWFWLTPIIYPLNALPPSIQAILAWNPMLPVVRNYQTVLLGQGWPDWSTLDGFAVLCMACLLVAAWLYHRARSQLVDEL